MIDQYCSWCEKEGRDIGHEDECPGCQRDDVATLRARLVAMTEARDAWREEAEAGRTGHAPRCKSQWTEHEGRGPCDCPAALDPDE